MRCDRPCVVIGFNQCYDRPCALIGLVQPSGIGQVPVQPAQSCLPGRLGAKYNSSAMSCRKKEQMLLYIYMHT